jgi:hypothetical protein
MLCAEFLKPLLDRFWLFDYAALGLVGTLISIAWCRHRLIPRRRECGRWVVTRNDVPALTIGIFYTLFALAGIAWKASRC